jgi:hypothetical protein
MKTYKGFDKDLKCRGFQYEIGKSYEQDGEVKACEKGFHACEYPLDCFVYYSPTSSRFCEVEQDGEISKDTDDTKVASSKIKIGAEINIAGMVEAAVGYTTSRAKKVKGTSCRVNRGVASSTGCQGVASSTGCQGAASSTGCQGVASSTGCQGAASSTGNYGVASSTGCQGVASSTGDYGVASSTGCQGAASSTGDSGVASSTGYRSVVSSTGCQGVASSTGYRSVVSSTGNYSAASALNPTAIAVAWGFNGRASGVKGAYIVCAEWGEWNGKEYPFIGAKMVQVDGVNIKENTFYTLKNGEFIEVSNE